MADVPFTHKEDCKLRKLHWNKKIDIKRVIMHDNTNVDLPKPSDADKQRSLHSKYYGRSCAKGGVAFQLSGWVRTLNLFTGGIDDNLYIDQSKIFKQQKLFQEHDLDSSASIIEFINIFDKGYCSTTVA